jgi:hypothetical protein
MNLGCLYLRAGKENGVWKDVRVFKNDVSLGARIPDVLDVNDDTIQ